MSVSVTIDGTPTDGASAIGVTPVTVSNGEDTVIVTVAAPVVIAGFGYETGFAGATGDIYVNVAEPGASASWMPYNVDGTQLSVTVTAGSVERFDYTETYAIGSFKVKFSAAQTADKVLYLLWYHV